MKELVRPGLREILEHFRMMEEIDRTSYQAGVNEEKNLEDVMARIQALIIKPLIEEAKKQTILELEEDGLLAHEIMSYGASGRECEETCGSCKLLQVLKEGEESGTTVLNS